MKRFFAGGLLFLALSLPTAAWSQDQDEPEVITVEPGASQEVAPGVTITVNPDAGRANYQIAETIAYQPHHIESTIAFGDAFAPVSITLSSRVDTRVRIEAGDELEPLSKDEWLSLLSGYRTSVSFTAYEAHRGTLRIFNERDELLATVPYTVAEESQVFQSIRAAASTSGRTDSEVNGRDMDFGYGVEASYAITERTTGVTGTVRVAFDGDLDVTGRVSGRVSW